jgi:hypothetical protein
METIRIIRKKSKAPYVWGILLTLIILGVVAWLLMDRNIIDRGGFTLGRDNAENDTHINDNYRDRRDLRDFRDYRDGRDGGAHQESFERDQVNAYVSFVNRQIVPADEINNQLIEQALTRLERALEEVSENTIAHDNLNRERSVDTADVADSRAQLRNNADHSAMQSLINTGTQLVEIQQQEYPSLDGLGTSVEASLRDIDADAQANSNGLKEFFILSSSLIQEMDSERNNDQLTTNRRNHENY